MAAAVIYHLNVQEKQNKEWSFVHRTTFIVLCWCNEDKVHRAVPSPAVHTHKHSHRSKSLYVLSGYIMQQPSNKTMHRMLHAVWAIESMTFLFQCIKYIPLCLPRRNYWLSSSFVRNGFKCRAPTIFFFQLFLPDIETSLCFCFYKQHCSSHTSV